MHPPPHAEFVHGYLLSDYVGRLYVPLGALTRMHQEYTLPGMQSLCMAIVFDFFLAQPYHARQWQPLGCVTAREP